VSPGLGSALARRFAARGFDLLLLNRSTPPMQAVAAELSRSSTRVDTQQVDVTDRAALIDAITAGTAQLGPIAVLIFNPTGFTPEPAARVNIEALRRDLNVAVLGAVTAVQTSQTTKHSALDRPRSFRNDTKRSRYVRERRIGLGGGWRWRAY
jgi:NADP-dependent 3-hydroxy acid dehydrogenase YdfG